MNVVIGTVESELDWDGEGLGAWAWRTWERERQVEEAWRVERWVR